ncbi:cellulose biosynthesis cyclic di-GMP-binding regulatory protein BcsB [Rhodoferax aquaticus]|uniref:Cyclic di-GMP-binding protein n=1 Tax=Rhodoferax aquaticus TaxID=2527691 RepID=A0A515EKB7_9BURK|nr:cellulose biosynthesis cyclic di-GMP-binding regulatory protein BcsB [Rhodoferax aquaticus]QDL53096.1 cellulose biosynthesis cyclic di-GMP-binding regulatory protein BcsB [Rhodoferax aquaticus]
MTSKLFSYPGSIPKYKIAAGLGAVLFSIATLVFALPAASKSPGDKPDTQVGAADAASEKTTPKNEKKSKSGKATKVAEPIEEVIDSAKSGPKQRVVSLTFKQMGAWSSIKLRGVDGYQSLQFPVRADEVVVSAKLRMAYDYSPALIPELSHLQISLNERVVAVEGLPKDKGVGNSREINLDPRLFGDLNSLGFKLIGHYTRQCEDPFHSSLWLTLSDLGRLELTLAPLSVSNDLKTLPLPFLDKRENAALKLPFVFSGSPSFGTLKAAGVVASWFGMQAGTRGAQFPTTLNTLPNGNAVVFLRGADTIEGIKGAGVSNIAIQPHPTNVHAKLLVISGATEQDLLRAANTLALYAPTLTGQSVTVTKEVEPAPRKPYDAPAWLPTDRPVKFGELVRPDELHVQGYFPSVVRINYRVTPDLFTWRSPGAPMKLKYRATRLPFHKNSSLNVSLNANFIETIALNANYPLDTKTELTQRPTQVSNGATALREERLALPPYAVGGRNQLQLGYFFDVIKEGECMSLPPDNLQASIDAESTLDFSGYPHYVALPNLAYFASLGFPFTRFADLSETAVVLPDNPNADEMGVYLAVMGRMGESTAYPVLRHSVISAAEVDRVASKDLIIIGSGRSQTLMSKWADHLPMVQQDGERRVRERQESWWPSYRWEQEDVNALPVPPGSVNFSIAGSLAAMMGFQSPLQATRSAVFLYADKAGDLRKVSEALVDPERIPMVQGDFVVVDDKSVNHARVSETYYLGSLAVTSKIRWFFADQPILMGLLALFVAVLLATLVYRMVRRVRGKRQRKLS